MEKLNTLGNRIKHLREQKGLTLQQVSESIKISSGYLSEVERDLKVPGSDLVRSLKRLFNVSTDWLLEGEGSSIEENKFIFIPQVKGEIGAGGGLTPDDMVEMKVAFKRDWIQRKGNPQKMSLIRVRGDSMEPTFLSGDLVMVDHSRNYVDPQGGIYAIAIDGEIAVKRIQVMFPSKRLRIISDNDRYESIEVDPDQVIINGKILWFGREIER